LCKPQVHGAAGRIGELKTISDLILYLVAKEMVHDYALYLWGKAAMV
jgi:hypothetical protein